MEEKNRRNTMMTMIINKDITKTIKEEERNRRNNVDHDHNNISLDSDSDPLSDPVSDTRTLIKARVRPHNRRTKKQDCCC